MLESIPLGWQSILLLICLASVAIVVFLWGRGGSSLSHYIRTAELLESFMAMRSNKNDDELLFRDPPPKEDCPICFLPMSHFGGIGIGGVESTFQSCCGKTVCSGCIAAVQDMSRCPFCRVTATSSDKEHINRTKLRMKAGDANAFNQLAQQYDTGSMGLPKDYLKAYELWKQAADLGSISAHYNISLGFLSEEKAAIYNNNELNFIPKYIHHLKVAAIGGHEVARNNLGAAEASLGNMNRAMKHWMIAARAGFDVSLKQVGKGYKAGLVTKDEYAITLRAYQSSLDEMKSEQRTKVIKPCPWKETLSEIDNQPLNPWPHRWLES